MTAFFFFFLTFVLFGQLGLIFALVCFLSLLKQRERESVPTPSTLTHHVDHSPSFAVHPFKSNITEGEEQWDAHTVIQIKLAGVYFAFEQQNMEILPV